MPDVLRAARFTDAAHTEVELAYPHEGPPHDKDNGRKMHAYYPIERYEKKQAEHGLAVYPPPAAHSL